MSTWRQSVYSVDDLSGMESIDEDSWKGIFSDIFSPSNIKKRRKNVHMCSRKTWCTDMLSTARLMGRCKGILVSFGVFSWGRFLKTFIKATKKSSIIVLYGKFCVKSVNFFFLKTSHISLNFSPSVCLSVPPSIHPSLSICSLSLSPLSVSLFSPSLYSVQRNNEQTLFSKCVKLDTQACLTFCFTSPNFLFTAAIQYQYSTTVL